MIKCSHQVDMFTSHNYQDYENGRVDICKK